MTIIVAYKVQDRYYLSADSRLSGGAQIITDNDMKLIAGDDYIAGVCGNGSDQLVIQGLLSQTCDPWEVLMLGQKEPFRDLLIDCSALVHTKHYGTYVIDRDSHDDSRIEHDSDSRPKLTILTLHDSALPHTIGSGSREVSALLSKHTTLSVKKVEDAIIQAYKVNFTIGGPVKTLYIKAEL